MNWETILAIVSSILFIISIVTGVKWSQAKNVLKEVAEALTVTSEALADDAVSNTERQTILKEWGDVIAAAKALIGRQ